MKKSYVESTVRRQNSGKQQESTVRKNGLGDSMIQGRTALGRAMLEGITVGNSKKGMKKGLGYSKIQGRTV